MSLPAADGSPLFSSDLAGPTTTAEANNAAQIAEANKSNPHWNGQPVRLITCCVACGPAAPAQDVANILGVPVEGATGPVGVPRIPNSKPSVGNNGNWTTFNPTKKAGL